MSSFNEKPDKAEPYLNLICVKPGEEKVSGQRPVQGTFSRTQL